MLSVNMVLGHPLYLKEEQKQQTTEFYSSQVLALAQPNLIFTHCMWCKSWPANRCLYLGFTGTSDPSLRVTQQKDTQGSVLGEWKWNAKSSCGIAKHRSHAESVTAPHQVWNI